MPFINTKTTKKLDTGAIEALKSDFGKAIELIPGKSEKWLMLNFEDGCKMAFAGSFDDCAMIEVEILGTASKREYDALTASLSDAVSKRLGIPKDRIYVKYEEISTWGFDGENF